MTEIYVRVFDAEAACVVPPVGHRLLPTLIFMGWYQGHPLVTAVPPVFLGDPFLFSWWELRGRDYEGDMRLARCFLLLRLTALLMIRFVAPVCSSPSFF
jgi:hypothetical protein